MQARFAFIREYTNALNDLNIVTAQRQFSDLQDLQLEYIR